MRLCDCAAGKLYMIRTVTAEETIVRRLEALGLVEGTKVHILMKKQDGSDRRIPGDTSGAGKKDRWSH